MQTSRAAISSTDTFDDERELVTVIAFFLVATEFRFAINNPLLPTPKPKPTPRVIPADQLPKLTIIFDDEVPVRIARDLAPTRAAALGIAISWVIVVWLFDINTMFTDNASAVLLSTNSTAVPLLALIELPSSASASWGQISNDSGDLIVHQTLKLRGGGSRVTQATVNSLSQEVGMVLQPPISCGLKASIQLPTAPPAPRTQVEENPTSTNESSIFAKVEPYLFSGGPSYP